MVEFKRSVLCVALLSAMQAMTVTAYAHDDQLQDAQTDTASEAEKKAADEKSKAAKTSEAKDKVETVEVIGIRRSIMTSLDSKRESDVVADFVDAGDLGSLPDQSIADALGRIPGVTTVRDSGQSSQLNIRGMNGDFIQTTLNGREQASTSAYTESTRWMAFDQFPAELINSGAVFKSPKASHVEGGVAGTVELKTINPLKMAKDQAFNASVRGSYNDAAGDTGGDETGERVSASYVGKFLNNTLGVAVGYARLVQPNNFEGSRAAADGQLGYASADVNGDGQADARARAFQFQAGSGNDIRNGYMGTLVFQPNDAIKATVDYFKSDFESEDFRHGITVGGMGNLSTFALQNPVVSNGVVTGGTVRLTEPRTEWDSSPWFETRTEDQSTQSDSESYGFNLEWTLNERSMLAVDVSHSEASKSRRDRIASLHAYEFGTATGLRNGQSVTGPTWQERSGQAMTYVMNGDNTPGINFNTDYTDLSYMRLSRYEEYPHLYTDEIDSAKLDYQLDVQWGAVNRLEMGVRQSDRMFDSRRGTFLYGSRDGQFNYVNNNGDWVSYCADNLSLPNVPCAPQSIEGFTRIGSVAGGPDHLIVNLDGLGDKLFGAGNYTGRQVFSRDWTFVESGGLEEKTLAYYLMANLDMQIGGIPVTGNFGVRFIETDVKASGVQNVGAGKGRLITDDLGFTSDSFDYVKYGPEYDDTLPSLNLNFALTPSDILRVAAAKVMGRPPAGQLKGGAGSWNGGDLGPNQYNVWTKGSPYLDPFRATQLDLSYEHYFEDGGAVTAAVFWKDIDSLVEQISYAPGTIDFDTLGIQTPEGMVDGIFQTFQNSEKGGYIRGAELAVTKTFTQLPGIWSGLGVTASYSYTESETEIGGGSLYGRKLPLPGLSKNVWSVTGFWSLGGFASHINVRYRDDYVLNMPVPGSSTPVIGKEYMTIDAQASYAFGNGMALVLQGNNLTDEANKASYGEDSVLGEYKTFGRQYYLGLNFSY